MTALLVGCGISASATTHYVAPPPSGNDGNPGTLASPWATLQHAADTLQPGDSVRVRAGNYAGGYFSTSGTALAPIVLEAYPGETPQITSDNPTTPDGINLEGASYMTVQGFVVNGRTRAGIRAVECSQVTIRNNSMDQNGRWGILTGFCDDLLIENKQRLAQRGRARHLRGQQRRSPGHPSQHDLGQPRQRHSHERRCLPRR